MPPHALGRLGAVGVDADAVADGDVADRVEQAGPGLVVEGRLQIHHQVGVIRVVEVTRGHGAAGVGLKASPRARDGDGDVEGAVFRLSAGVLVIGTRGKGVIAAPVEDAVVVDPERGARRAAASVRGAARVGLGAGVGPGARVRSARPTGHGPLLARAAVARRHLHLRAVGVHASARVEAEAAGALDGLAGDGPLLRVGPVALVQLNNRARDLMIGLDVEALAPGADQGAVGERPVLRCRTVAGVELDLAVVGRLVAAVVEALAADGRDDRTAGAQGRRHRIRIARVAAARGGAGQLAECRSGENGEENHGGAEGQVHVLSFRNARAARVYRQSGSSRDQTSSGCTDCSTQFAQRGAGQWRQGGVPERGTK